MSSDAEARAPDTDAGSGPPAELSTGVFRIDRDGRWRHEGQEVTHPGVLANLYANLRGEGSACFLQVGPRQVGVLVDDVPFVVTRVEEEAPSGGLGPPVLRLHLTDGSSEPLDPETLRMASGSVPYCRVKRGRFSARLSLQAWLQLAGHVTEERAPGPLVLALGDRRFPIPGPP